MKIEKILIGWAERDITPDRPVNLYGQFHPRISEYVKDPITVTALAIGTERDYVVMVSCDICSIKKEVCKICREKIKKALPEIDTLKVVFNATHTHTAPTTVEGDYPPEPEGVMTPPEYAEFFTDRVTEAVVEAWNKREKTGVSWAYGHAVVAHNRRAVYFDDISKRPGYQSKVGLIVDGTSKMYGNTNDVNFSHIEGYTDHSLETLFTWDKNGNLTGVVINLACPSQETEGTSYVSADFWHEIRTEVRKRCGEGLYVLPQCSSAGDQSPHRLLYGKAEDRMLQLRGTDMRQEIGRRVGVIIEELIPYAKKDIRTDLPFKHIAETIPLKKRLVTEDELRMVKEEMAEIENRQPANHREELTKFKGLLRCRSVVKKYEEQKNQPFSEEEIHIVRLGDIAFTTNRFELFLDYGLRIKARSPFIQTFIVQLAGEGPYLSTERAVAGRGYSAVIYDNDIGPEGGQQLVEETVKILKEIYEEKENVY